jgi:hypothetical protein
MILGYPWFTAVQPKIDWAKGWIDYTQLPIVISIPKRPSALLHIMTALKKRNPLQLRHTRQTKASELVEQSKPKEAAKLPLQYQKYTPMFSEWHAQWFPEPQPWDHAIELKKDTLNTLPGKIYSLTQPKRQALQVFIKEHLAKGYICPLKSPYATPFFFIKKKMESYAWSKTTERSMNGPLRTGTPSLLSQN